MAYLERYPVSRAIGTPVETAIKRYAAAHGFPFAERLPLAGSLDMGDVRLCQEVIVEAKGGKAAENASALQLERWLDETEKERVNAGAEIGLLVTKRKGVSGARAGAWDCHLTLATMRTILMLPPGPWPCVVLRLTFDSVLSLLAEAGLGSVDPVGRTL